MSLSPPPYIPYAPISGAPVTYRWSDYDPYSVIPEVDDAVMDCLDRVSNRANTAFTLGCAEWVIFRLNRIDPDSEPTEALEAYWLWAMDADPGISVLLDDQGWAGPVRGPIHLALLCVSNSINMSEDGLATNHAAIAAGVALLVLPDPQSFLDWQGKALTRLEALYPRDLESPDGHGVPREALDPAVDVTPDNEAALIRAYVESLDRRANRFLVLFDQGYE